MHARTNPPATKCELEKMEQLLLNLATGLEGGSAYLSLLGSTVEAFVCPEHWSSEQCQAAGEVYQAHVALQEAAEAGAVLDASPYGKVERFLLNLVEGAEGFAAYGLIFGILLICGLGVPMPEDISLTLGGYLAYRQEGVTLWGMMVTGYLGIIVGDSLIYFMGRKLGGKVGTKPKKGFWGRLITPEKRGKVERIFEKYGDRVVMVARFMPGLRAITYFVAGSVRLKYGRFVLYDSIAALASAPIFVFLGWYFGGELERVFHGIKEGKTWAVVVFAVAVVSWLIFWFGRKKFRMRKASAKLAEVAKLAAKANEVNDVQREEHAERL